MLRDEVKTPKMAFFISRNAHVQEKMITRKLI